MNTHEVHRAEQHNTRAMACEKFAALPDAWAQTVLLLDRLRAQQEHIEAPISADDDSDPTGDDAVSEKRKHCRRQSDSDATRDAGCPATITLLERLSPRTVVLRWCSTSCHYGFQIWVSGKASRSGVCAVTGEAIRRGDDIYRPQTRTRVFPVNANAMIRLAAFV